MKAIGIVCSPRRDGNTADCVRYLLDLLPKKWEKKIINLYDYVIHPCGVKCQNECQKGLTAPCDSPEFDDRVKVLEEMKKFDIIILGTPAYIFDIPAQLRSFLERDNLSPFLEGKLTVFIILANVGKIKVFSSLAASFILDARAIVLDAVFADGYMEKGKTIKQERTRKLLKESAERIIKLKEKLPISIKGIGNG